MLNQVTNYHPASPETIIPEIIVPVKTPNNIEAPTISEPANDDIQRPSILVSRRRRRARLAGRH